MTAYTIRSSSLTGYADCPRRTIASVLKREIIDMGYEIKKMRNGAGAAVGTGTHSAANLQAKTKIISGTHEGTLSDSIEVGIESLREEIKDGASWDATTQTANEAEKQVRALSKVYYHQVIPFIKPLYTEKAAKAEIRPGVILSGHLDMLDENFAIHDLKTGVIQKKHHPQMGGYSLLAKAEKLVPQTSGLFTQFIKRVKVNASPCAPITTSLDVAVAEMSAINIAKHIMADVKQLRATQDPKDIIANTSSMLCSPKYCSVYNTEFCPLTKEPKA